MSPRRASAALAALLAAGPVVPVAVTVTIAVAFPLATTAGCGLRGNPRPPEFTMPVIPGTVQVARDARGVVLRWQRPERSADGERLEDLSAFVVEKKGEGDAEWLEVATIDVVDQEKIRRRRDFSWRDPDAGPAAYRVTAVCADGQRGEPVDAVAKPSPPPGS